MNTQPITKEALIDAPISRVWRSITNVDDMKQWYMDISSLQPTVGFEFSFYGGEKEDKKYHHLCRITEVVPQRKLAYSWQYENLPGSSVVTFELEEQEGKTKVKLTHEGTESFAENGPDFVRENFITGWEHFICNQLKKYLEDPHFWIERSIEIDASPEKVWQVLTITPLNRKWSCGFGENVRVETDFKQGSSVLWKMGEDTLCGKGVAAICEPNKQWKTEFYGFNECMEFNDQLGAFSEDFQLGEQNGKTVLLIRSGPFNAKWHEMIYPGWDVALPLVKQTAEDKMNIIIKENLVDAPIARVWKAITNADEMRQWYMDIANFEPTVGYEFSFWAGEDGKKYKHNCRVTEVVPERRLAHTWQYENLSGSSVVTFELVEEEGKTRVKFFHEGVGSFAVNGADFAKENFIAGWDHCIGTSIKKYLEDLHFFIDRSIQIDAAPEKVWEVLTTIPLTRQWTCGFGEGVYLETDFKVGSEVFWKMGEGTLCAKGVVTISEPAQQWKTEFYGYTDDFQITDEFGVFSEDYKIMEQDGKTMLVIRAGPFNAKWHDMIYPGWDKALPLIKQTAEETNLGKRPQMEVVEDEEPPIEKRTKIGSEQDAEKVLI